MQFSQLYTTELDRELGNSSTQLFTTDRRKAAINAAQLEFVKRTECLTRQTTVALVDATQEYDLNTISNDDFGWISKQGPSIKMVSSGGSTTYIEGDDLEETSVERLNVEEPGWRAVSAGVPRKYYLRADGGHFYFGLHPAPDVPSGATWTTLLPYVCIPADMSGDTDEPFTFSGTVQARLRMWHRALPYFAAADLEKLRKEVGRVMGQLQLWELELQKYFAAMKPKQGAQVRLAVDYRARARRGVVLRRDPRVW